MKLYLSSSRLGDHVNQLHDMASTDGRFALVPNALDYREDPEERDAIIQRGVSDLEEAGFSVSVVDLRDFFDSPQTLPDRLESFMNVFVTGGNVFVLRRAMRQSGFDAYIQRQKANPDYLYAGYSAGSCICAPRLDGLHLLDDPSLVPAGYVHDVDYTGLSLIPHAFMPHYASDHPESAAINDVVAYCVNEKIPFRAYRDGEVLIQP